jgi:hypothetical protein
MKYRDALVVVVALVAILALAYSIEPFASASTVFVDYLSATQTAAFILADVDTYIASLSIPDLYARGATSHSEYRTRAAKASVDFTEAQKTRIDDATDRADAFFATSSSNDYIEPNLMRKIRWRFAMTNDTNVYEGGFPHTRADLIFVTPALIDSKDLIKTLVHEKVHVYQRKHGAEFQAVLKKKKYVRLGLRSTVPLIRANPDLDKYVYEDPAGEVMAISYASSKPKSIMDIDVATNDTKREHPYETIAYAIGELA